MSLAATHYALWQTEGEIVVSRLGDASVRPPGILQRQRNALLEIIAIYTGKQKAKVIAEFRSELAKNNNLTQLEQSLQNKSRLSREATEFDAIRRAYMDVGGRISRQATSSDQAINVKPAPLPRRDSRTPSEDVPIKTTLEITPFSAQKKGKIYIWDYVLEDDNPKALTLPMPREFEPSLKKGKTVFLVLEGCLPLDRMETTVSKVPFSTDRSFVSIPRMGLPKNFFPGMKFELSWLPQKRTLIAKFNILQSPVRFNGRLLQFEYDAPSVTRNTAPGGPATAKPSGLSAKEWVLRTLQVVGYLDAEGVAVLAEEALERNMVRLGFPAGQLHRVTHAVSELLNESKIHRVQGSIGSTGHPIFPSVPHKPPIDLLCFRPQITPASDKASRKSVRQLPQKPQTVSGFVRRLPAGQQASMDALDAHEEAQRRAEVANDKPLKPGYTFVRKHRRNH
ncbi:hypothetical protein BKA00_005793 [Actinomadura coerulea]|uniref:Uncharacterized protein n=1 Tax=Actinomadura coerulea TaxID=46159 RepID=A0A7X0G433_9ACTN|nr:hypothetical protein [Actinomadura coerulea]MBB6398879.1 hypothetical protein [Actinomadura coerulea]